jgi:DNA-binding CsgD family transcriptional regulator/tetratricopeptide (TPR) repeat protein
MPELLEREELLAQLDSALGEGGRLVFVGGEAGVGKTALARRFVDDQSDSLRVLWGACDALFTPRALGPFLDFAQIIGGKVEELVRSGARPHEVAAALIRELETAIPTILVLEDVHWADEATLDVVRLLGRRIGAVPALVLVTYRSDELENDHPLRIVLGELVSSEAVGRLTIERLSPAAVSKLAEPHGVDAEELYRKTAGNPFFVTEALAAGGEGIPDTVRDAVLGRAARLGPEAKTLLEAVAVVPPQAEFWLLEALAGEAVSRLDECLTSGMLTSEPLGVAFRHELARRAVEESVALNRKVGLHRKALAALAEPPSGAPDLARLAHHADAAGDADAVLRFAPAAAAHAASLGAHREAAAQYAHALRFGDGLPLSERAELLERQADACYLTDQYDEGIAALEEALKCRRLLGDGLREGDALRRLSEFVWCPGRTAEAERSARDAVALLESLPPGRELAMAYANLAATCGAAARSEEAIAWAERALDLAERLNDDEIAVHALATIGVNQFAGEGPDKLEQSLEHAQSAGLAEQVGRVFVLLAGAAVSARRHAVASRQLEAGIDYCSDQGLELFRLYLLAFRARLELDQGRWMEAADSAATVLRIPRSSTTPRIHALVVLGLVRARRGDPGQWAALDEAWTLAEPTGELHRLGPVAAARAEAAWLEGDRDVVAAATEGALPLALERKWGLLVGELVEWRRRAGLETEIPSGVAEPYALELAGEWARAAELWTEIGCPYEAALALADADEEEPLRQGLEELQRLGARPAAEIVARRLRERGATGIARGPRPQTQSHPAGLTRRELDVLDLLGEGMTNGEIAARLVIAEKTVGHHVSSILGKLGVRSRYDAAKLAAQDRELAPPR